MSHSPNPPWEKIDIADLTLLWDRVKRRGVPSWGAGAPAPWVLVDLDPLWVMPEGVPDEVIDEIHRCAARAFRLCTEPDEWIYAWDQIGVGFYHFWPHRQPLDSSAEWRVSFFPDGDDQLFISQDLTWGVHAFFPGVKCEWSLVVFGQRIFDAFSGHWPDGWSAIIEQSEVGTPPRR